MSINASLRSVSARAKKHRTREAASRTGAHYRELSPMTAASVQTPHQKMYELYLKRRIQRIGVLKNVIKQWHQLQHTEWFFGTLEAWHSATEGHDFVPDHFLDLIADVVQEDESSLDVAVDRLAAANKRVHEAIEAMDMNRRGLGARRDAPPLAAKAPGGKYNYGQVSDIVRKVATNPKLGRQSAVDILDRDGGGVANVSKLKPENLDKVYEACRVLLVGEGLLPALTGREGELGYRKNGA